MEWGNCKYRHLAEKISDIEIDSMVDAMIDNCDKHDKYFNSNKMEEFVTTFVHSRDFLSAIEMYAQEECKKSDSQYSREFSNIEFLRRVTPCILGDKDEEWEQNYIEEEKFRFVKNEIYKDILNSIEQTAREKRRDRLYSRLNVGEKVNLDSCALQEIILENIWFYKDGGWGIANPEGIVIVKNHLVQKPEWNNVLFDDKKPRYIKIQDRDTGLYGVLSLESFKEVIHCLYDEIRCISYWDGDKKKYVVEVKTNDKWGCYDENCAFIIECKYDYISITDKWIECSRDGSLQYYEYDYEKNESVYNGVKDLYTTEGVLLLGGYNHFEYDYKRYFKFYFGIQYEECSVKKKYDSYGNEIVVSNYRLNYNDSLCIVLDSHFRTIIKSNNRYFQIPRGITIKSRQELDLIIPKEFLFYGHVDLSDINRFIYITRRNGEKYVVSEYIEGFMAEIPDGVVSQEARWNDNLIEDDEVIIVRIGEDGTILWRTKVNEIGPNYSGGRLYRRDDNVGFFSFNGVSCAEYAAVSIDCQEDKAYVAKIVYLNGIPYEMQWNPNFIPYKQQVIQYFELLENGELKRMKDDWKEFNPKKHKWFPDDFLYKNGVVEDFSDNYYESEGRSYEKYGGYNGYDDDTIDYGFDGYPEATWNVD